jgi:23S rRNA (guanine745-N1)-methyltransferase
MIAGMDPRIVECLRCPVCRGGLRAGDRMLTCPSGHAFDLARQGYVDLSGGTVTHPGDTAPMVEARTVVLSAGHLDVVTDAIAAALSPYPPGLVVDVGAGTGHHLARLLEAGAVGWGVAVDVSKAALRRAGRAHPRLGAVRADAWRGLPIADGVAAAVLNVFAPRAGREFARVLAPGGRLIVVTPMADHLRELSLALGVDPNKEERVAGTLAPHFVLDNQRELRATLRLTADDATAFAAMGPNAHHRLPAQAVAGPVTAAVRVSVWVSRAAAGPAPREETQRPGKR